MGAPHLFAAGQAANPILGPLMPDPFTLATFLPKLLPLAGSILGKGSNKTNIQTNQSQASSLTTQVSPVISVNVGPGSIAASPSSGPLSGSAAAPITAGPQIQEDRTAVPIVTPGLPGGANDLWSGLGGFFASPGNYGPPSGGKVNQIEALPRQAGAAGGGGFMAELRANPLMALALVGAVGYVGYQAIAGE